MKPALSGATSELKFPKESDTRSRLQGKSDALKVDPPSNEKILEVLDSAAAALKPDDKSDPIVRHATQLVEATKQLAIKKNKGEHLQKAFKASAMAASEIKEGSPEFEQLKSLRHEHLRSVSQISRDLFYAFISDPDFRTNVSDMLEHFVTLFDVEPDEELYIPEGYHVDTSRPVTTATAVKPTGTSVTTTTKKVVPIKIDDPVASSSGVDTTPIVKLPEADFVGREPAEVERQKQFMPAKLRQRDDDYAYKRQEDWVEPKYTPISLQLQDRMRRTWNNLLLRFAANPKWSGLLNSIFELLDVVKTEHKKWEKEEVGSAPTAESSKGDNIKISERLKSENPQSARAARHMKSFVSNFVDDATLASFIKRLHRLSADIRGDENLRHWLRRLRSYIRMIQRNPDRDMETEKMRNRGNRLFADGHRLLSTSRFRRTLVRLSQDWTELIRQIGEDKELNAFTKSLKKLRDDVTIAKADGSVQLDFNALIEMRGVLLSVLLSLLKEVRLPTYEGEQGSYKFKVSGMHMDVENILPSQITILHETAANLVVPQLDPGTQTVHTSKGKASETFKKPEKSDIKVPENLSSWFMGKLIIRAENIITSIRDCKFWYQHTSFPKTSDSGEADLDILGRGMCVEIEFLMENDGKGGLRFTKGVVWVDMDKFKVSLRGTSHKAFYKVFKKAINKKIGNLMLDHIATQLAKTTGVIATSFNDLISKASPQNFLNSFMTTIDTISPLGSGGKKGEHEAPPRKKGKKSSKVH